MPAALLSGKGNKLRMRILLAVLSAVILAGGYHKVRVWRLERELLRLGLEEIEEENRADARPVPEEGPEARVEVETTCAFEYFFFGKPVGKVTLLINPMPHAADQRVQEISYIYTSSNGKWEMVDSYRCFPEEERRMSR